MTDEHEAVQLMFAVLDRVQERQDARRGDALRFGRAAGKLGGASRWRDRSASRQKRKQTHTGGADPDLFEKHSAIQCHADSISTSRPERQA